MEHQKSDKARKNQNPDACTHWGQWTDIKTAVDDWQPTPDVTYWGTTKLHNPHITTC